MMEREIRSTLARLERLIQVVPSDDQRVKKAIVDHTELKTKVVKNSANPLYNDEFSFVVRNLSRNSHDPH